MFALFISHIEIAERTVIELGMRLKGLSDEAGEGDSPEGKKYSSKSKY